MCDGTAWMKRVSVSGSTTVDVGLLGLQTKISRARSVTAASMASRSKVWSVNGTWMKRVSVSGSTTVDVGLLGLQTKISRARSVTAASMASRSKVWSVNGTWM